MNNYQLLIISAAAGALVGAGITDVVNGDSLPVAIAHIIIGTLAIVAILEFRRSQDGGTS